MDEISKAGRAFGTDVSRDEDTKVSYMKLKLTLVRRGVLYMGAWLMVDKNKLYSVSELAEELALTAQALRFYEEKGLLQPARSGRARVYTYRDRSKLLLILRLRRLGFSLDDIVQYLQMYGAVGGGQYAMGLKKIRERLVTLRTMRQELDQTIAELESLEIEAESKLRDATKLAEVSSKT